MLTVADHKPKLSWIHHPLSQIYQWRKLRRQAQTLNDIRSYASTKSSFFQPLCRLKNSFFVIGYDSNQLPLMAFEIFVQKKWQRLPLAQKFSIESSIEFAPWVEGRLIYWNSHSNEESLTLVKQQLLNELQDHLSFKTDQIFWRFKLPRTNLKDLTDLFHFPSDLEYQHGQSVKSWPQPQYVSQLFSFYQNQPQIPDLSPSLMELRNCLKKTTLLGWPAIDSSTDTLEVLTSLRLPMLNESLFEGLSAWLRPSSEVYRFYQPVWSGPTHLREIDYKSISLSG